jgi:NADPH:quinone reductase-like Zn-dependent oxidoreductase
MYECKLLTAGNCGAFAEYAVVPADLVAKTDGMDLPSAAALPLVGRCSFTPDRLD